METSIQFVSIDEIEAYLQKRKKRCYTHKDFCTLAANTPAIFEQYKLLNGSIYTTDMTRILSLYLPDGIQYVMGNAVTTISQSSVLGINVNSFYTNQVDEIERCGIDSSYIQYFCGDNNLTKIHTDSFINSTLRNVDLSNTQIICIPQYAFYNCVIDQIRLPQFAILPSQAFRECKVKSVDIGLAETIHPAAFEGCKHLERISIDPLNSKYTVNEGVVYNKEGDQIVWVPAQWLKAHTRHVWYKRKHFTVSGDLSIAPYAFANSRFKDIDLEDGIQTIEEYTFVGCENLQYISLPDTLTVIKQHAFERCKKLHEINIPANVVEIEAGAFQGCSKLKKIILNGNTHFTGNPIPYSLNCDTIELRQQLTKENEKALLQQVKTLHYLKVPCSYEVQNTKIMDNLLKKGLVIERL